MRFMVIVKANQDTEAGVMPSEQLLAEMGKYNEELVKAGIMLAGDGLHPSSKGVRVRFRGNERLVIDGPFAETKELIAGFWIWQVKSKEEAIEWVKRCPNPTGEESEIEIRQIFEADDFGAEFTPELREQEDRLRAESARYLLDPPRMENRPEMLIAGLNETYTFETRSNIPAQWQRAVAQLEGVPGQVGGSTYGVCWNYKQDCGFDYLAGVEVQNAAGLPNGFTHVRIPASRYAVFAHRGHVSTLPDTIDAIWTKWLPNSGHQAADSPSFERYTADFDPQTHQGGIEVWVPLKA
jgi:predicted transcriptional regulator YdeE